MFQSAAVVIACSVQLQLRNKTRICLYSRSSVIRTPVCGQQCLEIVWRCLTIRATRNSQGTLASFDLSLRNVGVITSYMICGPYISRGGEVWGRRGGAIHTCRMQEGRHRLFPNLVGRTANISHQWNIPVTTCRWSGFIAGYPSSCVALLLALSVSLSVRALLLPSSCYVTRFSNYIPRTIKDFPAIWLACNYSCRVHKSMMLTSPDYFRVARIVRQRQTSLEIRSSKWNVRISE